MSDPASLQNLNDIALPAPVAWWPPAPGWYVVLAVLLAAALWFAFRGLKRWQQNSYRRQALRELGAIEKRGSAAAGDIPVLLKRAALSAWPRTDVAGLSGARWQAFLAESAPDDVFAGATGRLLDRVSYRSGDDRVLSGEEFGRLCVATRCWLKRHRAKGD